MELDCPCFLLMSPLSQVQSSRYRSASPETESPPRSLIAREKGPTALALLPRSWRLSEEHSKRLEASEGCSLNTDLKPEPLSNA